MKFPIEMMTTLSNAPDGSVVIWTGSAFKISTDERFNIVALSAGLKALATDYAKFVNDKTPLLNSINDTSTAVAEMKPLIKALTQGMTSLNQEMQTINTANSSLVSRLATIEQSVNHNNSTYTKLMESANSTSSGLSSLAERVNNLESSGGYATRMTTIEATLTELTRRFNTLETTSQTNTTRMTEISTGLAQLSATVSNLQTSVTAIEHRLLRN